MTRPSSPLIVCDRVHRKRKTIEEEDAEVRRLEAIAVKLREQKLRLQEEVVQHTVGKWVRIKDHMPVVVTQEDVEEYGSLESALHGRTVHEKMVCIETVCIEFKCSYL